MARFLDAFREGRMAGESIVGSYERGLSYKEGLDEKKAAAAHESSKEEKDYMREDIKQSETERHNRAVESEWKPGSRGGSRPGGMDHEQTNALNYIKNLGAIAGKDSATPEDTQTYHEAVVDYAEKYGKPKPAAPPAAAPKEDDGLSWGKAASAISGAVKEGAEFFKGVGGPAPAQKPIHNKARLPDGRIITRNPDGSWPK